jgi:hypothetical protein
LLLVPLAAFIKHDSAMQCNMHECIHAFQNVSCARTQWPGHRIRTFAKEAELLRVLTFGGIQQKKKKLFSSGSMTRKKSKSQMFAWIKKCFLAENLNEQSWFNFAGQNFFI